MSASPRILLISGDFPPQLSGIGDYSEKLAGAMAKLGADVTVLTAQGESDAVDRPYKVRREIARWDWAHRKNVLEIVREYDVAHIQYPSFNYGRSMMINMLPHLISRHCPNTRSLVTIHDFRVMRWRWRARVSPMLWGIDGLIHVDPKDWPWLKSWMPLRNPPREVVAIAANAEPVPCTPEDRKRWRQELGFTDDETIVAFFGVLYPHKGLPELHAAIRSLRSKGKKVKLLAMGDFDRTEDWRAPMEAELREPHCVWVQGAPLDRVSECLHASDLSALPFHSGASTNRGSMLATLSHGLPTITTNGPCTPPDLGQMFDMDLVPVESAPALEQSIERLMNDETVRNRMRKNSLDTMAKMSWPAVARQTVDFYQRLLKGQPSTAPRVAQS